MTDTLIPLVVMTLGAGTPLIFAALGELVTEKSGVLNLGVEGMMIVGAIAAFITASATQSLWLGVGAGCVAGALMALLFAFLTLTLQANQVATGLALAIFGAGVSAFAGKNHVGVALKLPGNGLGALGDVPVLGAFVQAVHPMVILSWLLFAGVAWFLYRTRPGLVLRAVGESPSSAHSLGYPVTRIRYLATVFGGITSGLAGAYLSLVYAPLWLEGMTAGRGWIALALVVFASWRPGRVMLGAYLFGGITIAQFFAQGAGIGFASQAMSMLPYLATVAVLVLISRNAAMVRLNTPVSLGKPFHAGA
ncbi:ABC transporter permease [Variovorax soli]|uniref:ABC transporter permease n=1 Tax=Variovorax soli TaxID=376815 RepID=UPI0008391C8B|nr:ABC transporter permease [Variovorax soli]